MFERQMTTLPDADIQLLFRSTGRLGTIDILTFAKQVASISKDISGPDALPILPGHNIEFTTDPATDFTVIGEVEDPVFEDVTADTLTLTPSIPSLVPVVGEIIYVSPSSSDALAGHFAADNGTVGISGNPYTILDFGPEDVLAGSGIIVTPTDTTATVSLNPNLTGITSIEFTGPLGTSTSLTPDFDGHLIVSTPLGSGIVATSQTLLPDVAVLPVNAQFQQQTYSVIVESISGFGYLAGNGIDAGSGVALLSPSVTVTGPPVSGPLVVSVAFASPLALGYNVTLTPVSSNLPITYKTPIMSYNASASDLTQVTFNVDSVILPIVVAATTFDTPTTPTAVPTSTYSFGVQVVITGV
jgi:hypothetical protein